MRSFRLAALVGVCLCLWAFTPPASAQLALVSGPDEGNLNPNTYGWAGGGVQSPGEVAALFVFSNSGISTYFDPSVLPYDNIEDTQVGVLNLSSSTVYALGLSGPGVFGFDGDGIGTYGAPTNTIDTTTNYPSGGIGQSYGGPLTYFTGIDPLFSTGTANFIGGLVTGQSTFFSLEGPPSSIGQVTPTVPEPSSLLVAAIGTIGLVGYGLRRRRNLRTA